MQPPHLAMITHGKLSSHVHLNSAAHVRRSKSFSVHSSLRLLVSSAHFASPSGSSRLCKYLPNEHECPGEISTQNRTPHISMRSNPTISLGERRQRAHRRRFARPPRSLNRAGL